ADALLVDVLAPAVVLPEVLERSARSRRGEVAGGVGGVVDRPQLGFGDRGLLASGCRAPVGRLGVVVGELGVCAGLRGGSLMVVDRARGARPLALPGVLGQRAGRECLAARDPEIEGGALALELAQPRRDVVALAPDRGDRPLQLRRALAPGGMTRA